MTFLRCCELLALMMSFAVVLGVLNTAVYLLFEFCLRMFYPSTLNHAPRAEKEK